MENSNYCSLVQQGRSLTNILFQLVDVVPYLYLPCMDVVLPEEHHGHPNHEKSHLSWKVRQGTGFHTLAVASSGPASVGRG